MIPYNFLYWKSNQKQIFPLQKSVPKTRQKSSNPPSSISTTISTAAIRCSMSHITISTNSDIKPIVLIIWVMDNPPSAIWIMYCLIPFQLVGLPLFVVRMFVITIIVVTSSNHQKKIIGGYPISFLHVHPSLPSP